MTRDEEIMDVVGVKKRWRWLMTRDEEIMEVVDDKR